MHFILRCMDTVQRRSILSENICLPSHMATLKDKNLLAESWRANSFLSDWLFLEKEFIYLIGQYLSGLKVIKLFSCSTQVSMIFFRSIFFKMPTVLGILTFMSRKNSILCYISWYFYTYEQLKFHAQLSWAWKKLYNLGAILRWMSTPPVEAILSFLLWLTHKGKNLLL